MSWFQRIGIDPLHRHSLHVGRSRNDEPSHLFVCQLSSRQPLDERGETVTPRLTGERFDEVVDEAGEPVAELGEHFGTDRSVAQVDCGQLVEEGVDPQ